jgi:cytosine/adenosine deaminase-related metal-dependent hydrolase
MEVIYLEKTLIKNCYVLTMNPKREIIRDGYVLIDGNRILEVGKVSEKKNISADIEIDAKGKIVLPGLICTHCHTHGRASFGMPAPLPYPASFYQILNEWWWPLLEDKLTKENVYALAKSACLEMAKSGITCIADTMEAPNALPGVLEYEAKAFEEVGVRGIIAQEATERISKENAELCVKENLNFIKKNNKNPKSLVKGAFCVHTVYTCSTELLKLTKKLADENNALIFMHIEESTYDVEYSKKHYGKLPVEYLAEIGFLGANLLAAQCVQTTEPEIKLFSKNNVKVSHNLQTNMEVGVGIAPIPKMINEGINVSIGNDGFFLDMFENLRSVFLVHKGVLRDAGVLPADKVIEMATLGGAKALGLENEIGSIEPGKKADIIIVDLKSPTLILPENLTSQIVYLGSKDCVETVIVDGKIIVENGKSNTVDEESVLKEAFNASIDIWKRNKLI